MKIEKIISNFRGKSLIPLVVAGLVPISACNPQCLLTDACARHPPSVSDVLLLPQNPRDDDTLYLRYSVSADGPVSEEIKWVRNGSEFPAVHNQKRILPEYTKPEEVWRAYIFISNGDYRLNLNSPSVKIGIN